MTEYNANCFICNREIQLAWCWADENQTKIQNQNIAEDNPINGLCVVIAGGYGSCHDGTFGKMFICDGCFGDRIDRLMHVGDYMENAFNASQILDEAEDVVEAAYERIRNEDFR